MFMKYIPILLSAASIVAGHGYIDRIKINGEEFKNNAIGSNNKDSVLRSVTSQDPMKGADNKDLSCGNGSKPGKLMADINPGDEIAFSWVAADGSPWVHEVGPMITYMGLCGKGGTKDCSDVDSSTVKWFKIDNAGLKDDGHWEIETLIASKMAKVSIPKDIASGNYLIRHEIVALHLADSMGGAEFYAGCAQLKVGGDGTESPSSDELLSFPGAYKDDDKGIYVPSVFDRPLKYVFPGGNVAKLVAGSGGSGDDDGDDDSTPSSSSSAAPPSNTGAPHGGDSGSGSCRLKKKSTSSDMKKRGVYHPRRNSRIMRDLVSPHHS